MHLMGTKDLFSLQQNVFAKMSFVKDTTQYYFP